MEDTHVLQSVIPVEDWNNLYRDGRIQPLPKQSVGFLMFGQLFKGYFKFHGRTYLGTGWCDPTTGQSTYVSVVPQ